MFGKKRLQSFSLLVSLLFIVAGAANAQQPTEPQKPTMIAGAGGTKVAVYEYGNPSGAAILLIHGFSQSHLSWSRQYQAPALQKFRIVTYDLRGHGASEKPTNVDSYNSGKIWADDLNAIIKAKNLQKPVLVGWSFGGVVIGDYVREFGDEALGAIVFVGAGTQLGTEDAKTMYGPGSKPLIGMLDARQELNIPATAEFVRACTAKPLAPKDFRDIFAYNMAVSPEVRLAIVSRTIDSNDALAKIKVPVLIIHGAKDAIVAPAAADYIAVRVKQAKKSIFPNAGHSTFFENPQRFNRELAEFVPQ